MNTLKLHIGTEFFDRLNIIMKTLEEQHFQSIN